MAEQVIENTPLPKGRDAFTSIHVVGPCAELSEAADANIATLEANAAAIGKVSPSLEGRKLRVMPHALGRHLMIWVGNRLAKTYEGLGAGA